MSEVQKLKIGDDGIVYINNKEVKYWEGLEYKSVQIDAKAGDVVFIGEDKTLFAFLNTLHKDYPVLIGMIPLDEFNMLYGILDVYVLKVDGPRPAKLTKLSYHPGMLKLTIGVNYNEFELSFFRTVRI